MPIPTEGLAGKLVRVYSPEELTIIKHNARVESDPEYAKEVAHAEWAAREDAPLKESSDIIMLGASGVLAGKGLANLTAYSSPLITTAARTVNSIKEGTPRSLVGVPKMENIKKFTSDGEARDKVLWTATGNGIKLNGWNNLNTGQPH